MSVNVTPGLERDDSAADGFTPTHDALAGRHTHKNDLVTGGHRVGDIDGDAVDAEHLVWTQWGSRHRNVVGVMQANRRVLGGRQFLNIDQVHLSSTVSVITSP